MSLVASGRFNMVTILWFFFLVTLGFELRVFTLSHSTSLIFCEGFFEIGSHELFASAGFEP
jgi:hypothetical protein